MAEVDLRWHRYFAQNRNELTYEMVAALICREYGWDWETFNAQPNWFLKVIIIMLQNEAEAMNNKSKQ